MLSQVHTQRTSNTTSCIRRLSGSRTYLHNTSSVQFSPRIVKKQVICLLLSNKDNVFQKRLVSPVSVARELRARVPSILDLHTASARSSLESSSLSGGASSQKQIHGSGKKTAASENAATETAVTEVEAAKSPINKDATHIPGIIYPPATTVGKSTNIVWQGCMVKKEERQKLIGQKGCVIWITGLSGSGKSTLACALDHALLSRGKLSYVLDGDNLRHGLNNNLGFSAEDRAENIRRVGEVAKLFVDAGIICIASLISPYRKDRDACRSLVKEGEFIEVYMNFPLQLCEERDPKGLYKLARAGKIKGFTGIDDPYEAPQNCEVVMEPVDGRCPCPTEMAEQIVMYLEDRCFFGN